VRALAHTGKGRLGTLPDLPAVQDTIAGFEGYEWNGLFVPRGTSPDIIRKLNGGLNDVLRQPDVQARFKQLNIEHRHNTPDEFGSFVTAETDKWGKVVREAGIKLGS
jgi:tripartite-type tricarboxylate transporter receptor subunit TctC